ncbi:MAG TPA: sulfatase [Planctomycetota bacterium]
MIELRTARRLGALLLGALAACGGDPPVAPAPTGPVGLERGAEARPFERVVLVTLDTLRADHVSCYGYPRATTPFLDSLAARGVRFTRAMAAISHTAPSHATMLTGLVPAVHGVLQNGGTLAPGTPDLAATFAAEGYATGAFLNVKFLSGIAASFGTLGVRAMGKDRRPQTGGDVVDAAIEWLRGQAGARFLLWVHLYDPHKWKDLVLEQAGRPGPIWSGASPPDFLARVAALHGLPAPRAGEPYRVDWHVERQGKESVDFTSAEGFLRAIDAYDMLTLYADQQVQRLHAALEALALPGRTLWVVTSDHGEGLASHGVAGHGGRIYQEQLHVPLVVHASDGSLGPRVVEELVGHVDLFPTLVEVLGLRLSGHEPLFEGRSLWPLLEGREVPWSPRAVFAQRRPPEGEDDPEHELVYSVQDERHKLIVQEPGTDELYDLVADPREARNLGGDHADATRLRAALDVRLRAFGTLGGGATEEVPEEWLQELRDLGYVR